MKNGLKQHHKNKKKYGGNQNPIDGRKKEAMAGNQAGTATSQDVMVALNNWNQAQISLTSIADSETSVYKNLCLLLGIDENSKPELKKIPSFDFQLLDQLNLEKDK